MLSNELDEQQELHRIEHKIKMLRLMMRINVDSIAQEIRRVDGNNSMGAGQLAEKLVDYLLQDFNKEQP